jgi:hypothetical protein
MRQVPSFPDFLATETDMHCERSTCMNTREISAAPHEALRSENTGGNR